VIKYFPVTPQTSGDPMSKKKIAWQQLCDGMDVDTARKIVAFNNSDLTFINLFGLYANTTSFQIELIVERAEEVIQDAETKAEHPKSVSTDETKEPQKKITCNDQVNSIDFDTARKIIKNCETKIRDLKAVSVEEFIAGMDIAIAYHVTQNRFLGLRDFSTKFYIKEPFFEEHKNRIVAVAGRIIAETAFKDAFNQPKEYPWKIAERTDKVKIGTPIEDTINSKDCGILAVLNEREKTHGDFEKVSGISQTLKDIIKTGSRYSDLTNPMRESLDNVCGKIARIVCGNFHEVDHWRDIAGYATLVQKILEKNEVKHG
jgi:hypothetical protein